MNCYSAVLERYTQGAVAVQPALCCPTAYDPALLADLPPEIIAKDYGCGDPSPYVRTGDSVLDLGSGGGKLCYMAARLAGPTGQVIGVDMNDAMLALARHYAAAMNARSGCAPVRFLKGYIHDLALDVAALDQRLAAQPIARAEELSELCDWQTRQRREAPLIADGSVDLVISNCVLNLVASADKPGLFAEIARVLKPGGRIAISDIVADTEPPAALQDDPALWSGCIAGALTEQAFLQSLAKAGLAGVEIAVWNVAPWRTLAGVEFRSVTVTASKPLNGPCVDDGHAVIYRGPFREVHDDAGHVYPRGARIAVCGRSYREILQGPLARHFICLAPAALEEAAAYCAPAVIPGGGASVERNACC